MNKYILSFIFLFLCCQNALYDLKGNEYQLVNSPIRLAFSKNDNRFYGQAVNNYFGSYSLTPDNGITFSTVGTTMMMGPVNEMQAEHTYLTDLANVTQYQINGDLLILTLKNGNSLIFNKIGNVSE